MYIFASNGSGIYNTSIKVIIQICIETNIRQRGIGNPNPIKLGKCFQFLNDWYGFEKGGNHGNQYTVPKEKIFTLPKTLFACSICSLSIFSTTHNKSNSLSLICEIKSVQVSLNQLNS